MAASDAADYAAPAAGGVEETAVGPSSEVQENAALSFLKALFGAKPVELFILVWLLAGKKSKWFLDPVAAARYAAEHRNQDVYVGVALSPADLGAHRRCKAEETAGIVALWVDVDHHSEAHKKQNLPPTLEEALSLLPQGLPPSMILYSGHGVQAWWILKTPWLLRSPQDRAAAEQLVQAFNAHFQEKAAARGWEVDSTWDLARVMRIPDTTNTKVPNDHRPVELMDLNDRRYTREEICDYLARTGVPTLAVPGATPAPAANPGIGAMRTAPTVPAVGNFVLDPKAEPPFEKFRILCENERRALASWERKRPDLKDKSPSAHDLSLATFAAIALWTDQEIVNLLIAHRRKHNDDLKLRADYYKMTIVKSRAAAEEYWKDQEANEVLTELLTQPHNAIEAGQDQADEGPERDGGDTPTEPPMTTPAVKTSITPERRTSILTTLSTKFKVPLKRIVKFTGDDPRYRLETGLGDVHLGNVNGLIGQNRLRSSIAATTGKYLPHFDPDLWPGIASLLLDACEEVDRGRDATLIGTMTEWLRAYLRHKQPHESLEEADEGREPFTDDGHVYIFVDNFRHWLGVQQGEKIMRNMLTADLRTFGAVPEPFDLEVKGKPTTRSAWKLPAGLWEPETGPNGPTEQPLL